MDMDIKTMVGIIAGLAAFIGACVVVYNHFAKLVRFMDRQIKQDREIKEIKEEQGIMTEGILACLKGLHELGCNGPVTTSIDKIEKHLNAKAHEVDFR